MSTYRQVIHALDCRCTSAVPSSQQLFERGPACTCPKLARQICPAYRSEIHPSRLSSRSDMTYLRLTPDASPRFPEASRFCGGSWQPLTQINSNAKRGVTQLGETSNVGVYVPDSSSGKDQLGMRNSLESNSEICAFRTEVLRIECITLHTFSLALSRRRYSSRSDYFPDYGP